MNSYLLEKLHELNRHGSQLDNTSRSQVVIAIGAHKTSEEPLKKCASEHSTHSTKSKPLLDKILLDLNRLPDESECPFGCKLDVYVTVRHEPNCRHCKICEYNAGLNTYDFIGKGTYPYRQRGVDPDYNCMQKCNDFAERCDQLLLQLSSKQADKNNTRLVQQGPFYQIIDESMRNTIIQECPSGRMFQRKDLTRSEIDLYNLEFLDGR